MVSHLFFYQLVLVALVWLCLGLHWVWPSDPATVCPTAPEPPPPVPKRPQEPKSFAGLTPSRPATPVHTPAISTRRPPPRVSGLRAAAAARSTPPRMAVRTRIAVVYLGLADKYPRHTRRPS
jgi:hypothetical protein